MTATPTVAVAQCSKARAGKVPLAIEVGERLDQEIGEAWRHADRVRLIWQRDSRELFAIDAGNLTSDVLTPGAVLDPAGCVREGWDQAPRYCATTMLWEAIAESQHGPMKQRAYRILAEVSRPAPAAPKARPPAQLLLFAATGDGQE